MKGVLTGNPNRGVSGRTVLDMNPRYDFTGQVALVTGASSGMGQVDAMVDQTVDTFGRLDMAFNNAGIQAAHRRRRRAGRKPTIG